MTDAVHAPTDGAGVLLNLPIRIRESSAAMTPDQEQFFGEYHDYNVDNSINALENFKRLSGCRNWGVGSTIWSRTWRRCFNRTYDDAQYPFRDEASTYFDEFNGFFTYPRVTMRQQFAHLASFMGWRKNSREWKEQWIEYLRTEFASNYGTDASDLSGWQTVCKEVGEVPGDSITQCKKILSSIFINIFNLVECRDKWNTKMGKNTPIPVTGLPDIKKFPNYRSFRHYTTAGKIFPKSRAKADSFLKVLLRAIFH